MKVLMVIDRYFPIWGGAENQLRQLSKRLLDLGCHVTVVTRRWKESMLSRDCIDGIPVVRVGWPGTSLIATLGYILSLMYYLLRKRKAINVIHTHGAAALGALGSFAARITGLPNIAKIATAGRIPELTVNLPGQLILNLLKSSYAIICMSEEIRRELIAINTSPQRIVYITNGVDVNRFQPAPESKRHEWRIARGFSSDTPIAVFSGRLVPRKGIDVLVAAWHQVADLHPSAQLFILGSGADQPDSIENQVKSEVIEKGITNVTFVKDSPAIESYLNIADIFVFPSRKEGLPNALLEAMASGLATISSDIGGVVDLIKDDETGLLFPYGDVEALSDHIIELLNDPYKQKRLGARARQHVLSHYSFKQIAQQYIELYMDVMNSAPLTTQG